MLDHITLPVYDLEQSKAFYQQTLATLHFAVAFGEQKQFWAFGLANQTLFEIMQWQGQGTITPCHVAFRANSCEQVDAFYQAALDAGARCNGAPGLRPQYTATYYAAFVIELNGYNIEAVFDRQLVA